MSTSNHPGNLPRISSTLIGRSHDLEKLAELASRPLVTITGPGGVGKTKLSLEFGKHVQNKYAAGTWFVDLSQATSLEGICHAVGEALGVPLTEGDPVQQLGHALAGRTQNAEGKALLILDNFEQCIEHAAETVGQWLELAKDVDFVVTSRALLNLPGEVEYPLSPLGLPPHKITDQVGKVTLQATAKLESYASIKLFIERAKEASPSFKVSDQNIEAIGQICVRLDGIPLAIELAAARAKVLSPQKILERLKERFDLLKSRKSGAPRRTATLRGAIEWSWDLLSDVEKSVLAQLSVFVGGFFLEGAEEVVAVTDDTSDVVDVIQSLRDKSLLRAEPVEQLDGELRFSMYESVRNYAIEMLEVDAERAQETRKRWAEWLVAYTKTWWEKREGEVSREAFWRLQAESNSLVQVASEDEASEERRGWATVFASEVLYRTGPRSYAIDMLKEYLCSINVDLEQEHWVRVSTVDSELLDWVFVATMMNYSSSDAKMVERLANQIHSSSRAYFSSLMVVCASQQKRGDARAVYEAATRASKIGKLRTVEEAQVADWLGGSFWMQGQHERASAYFGRSLELARQSGEPRLMASALSHEGLLCYTERKIQRALDYFKQALDIDVELGDASGAADQRQCVGVCLWALGRLDEARELLVRSCEQYRVIGNRNGEAMALCNLAEVQSAIGNYDESVECASRAAAIAKGEKLEGTVAIAEMSFANAIIAWSRPSDAGKHLENAARICVRQSNAPGLCKAHMLSGDMHFVGREYVRAEAEYQRAREVASTIDEPQLVARISIGLAASRLVARGQRQDVDEANADEVLALLRSAQESLKTEESIASLDAVHLISCQILAARNEGVEDEQGALRASLQAQLKELGQIDVAIDAKTQMLLEHVNTLTQSHSFPLNKLPGLRNVDEKVQHICGHPLDVLITGETGVGKEIVAKEIHSRSDRSHKPMVTVNCAVLSPQLVASELFGHEKGAFTGASEQKIGLFEKAQGGTLFLDEVGNASAELQVALLRVLQEKTITPVGATSVRSVDVRVIAATSGNVEPGAAEGGLRRDLYHRLREVSIHVPPLRQRPQDIVLLADHFLRELTPQANASPKQLGEETIRTMQNYAWPGNVRELFNVVRTLRATCTDHEIGPTWLPKEIRTGATNRATRTARNDRRDELIELLLAHKGNVSSLARELNIARKNLYKQLKRYGIDPVEFRP